MYRNTSLSSVCRQHIHPFKAIIHTLLFIVSLLAVSACSLLGQGSASKPTPTLTTTLTSVGSPLSPTPAGSGNPVKTIHMIDATTGWAETSTSLLRTTNGWYTWRDVTPHKAALVDAGYFLTGSEAWIGEASGLSVQVGQKPAVIVSHTTNGGETWQSAALSVTVPEGVYSMSFINDQDGWSEAELGGVTGNDLVEIFRTTDGGKSWTAVSSTPPASDHSIPATFPYAGRKTGLTFINASTGWATSNGLYVTHDAGRTWQHQTLPIPAGILPAQVETDPPTFFTAHEGILPVRLVTEQGTLLYLYVTHDGGTTWHSSTPLPADLPDFLDVNLGWVTDRHTLYATRDGGQHWAKLTTFQDPQSIATPDFVTSDIGWAIGGTNTSQSLLKTTDGGYTWKTIFPF